MTLSANAVKRIIKAKERRKIDFKAKLLLGVDYPNPNYPSLMPLLLVVPVPGTPCVSVRVQVTLIEEGTLLSVVHTVN
jgi:hypothetical protein